VRTLIDALFTLKAARIESDDDDDIIPATPVEKTARGRVRKMKKKTYQVKQPRPITHTVFCPRYEGTLFCINQCFSNGPRLKTKCPTIQKPDIFVQFSNGQNLDRFIQKNVCFMALFYV
jgi:hypothetical protein